MKKKLLFGLAATLVVTLAAVFTVNSTQSDLLAQNIKALTTDYEIGTCCARPKNSNCGWCGLHKETAIHLININLAMNYCCDSCSSGTSGWGTQKCGEIQLI